MRSQSFQEAAMRPQNSTLTARRVHHCAAAILQDHLQLPDHGPKCRAGPLLTLLFDAAARLTSLSDACQSLRDAPSDEAARLALIATLPDFAALQRRLNAALPTRPRASPPMPSPCCVRCLCAASAMEAPQNVKSLDGVEGLV